MRPFNHMNARTLEEASAAMKKEGTVAQAGGGDLVGSMKDDIYRTYPKTVVNLKTIPGLEDIKVEDNMLKIGAMARLAHIELNPLVKQYAPIVGEAAGLCASPSLREMTTIGGNICQMPRCWYYRKLLDRFDCKRKGGDRCFALSGDNRYHSIFGGIKPGPTPCTKACPAGTDIPAYTEALRNGNWDEAADIVMQSNPLPMFTSRICPHPCQDGCNRNEAGDSVNIHCVERSVADHIMANIGRFYAPPANETGKSAAIIGAGPSGLTAAYYLRKAGHKVTVFERQPKAGGVMRYGVPHYRLPKDIVDTVVKALEDMGVEFRCGVTAGQDVTVEELDARFDGLFFGTGAWKQPILGIGGENLALFGLNFLTEVNTYLKKTIGKNVLVCGGGNVAMDVALTAKRLGADKVTLICLEKKEDMPASDEEILRAEEEGVVIRDGWGLGNVVTDDNGTVIGLDSKRCLSVRDANGRFNPAYDENDRITYESDFIILATGQAVDLGFLGDKFLAQLKSARGLFAIDAETYRTSHKGIYAAGDAASGPNIAIRAITGGRIAAMNMSKDFGVAIESRGLTTGFVHFDKAGAQEKQATAQTERPLAERSLTDEDASSYSPEQLDREIRRCTNCACYAVNQAETVPALLAMGAVIVTNEREIAAEEFFGVGVVKTTVLRPGEIVTEIRIPLVDGGVTGCYKRFSFRKSIDFPIINFAIVFDKDRNYRIWLGGVAPVPYHAGKAEAVLNGKDLTEKLAVEAGLAAVEGADTFEANSYKVQLIKTFIKRELLALMNT
jgi:NADPH-dependent glutamate synthase beta subunit-like oxidoreductase